MFSLAIVGRMQRPRGTGRNGWLASETSRNPQQESTQAKTDRQDTQPILRLCILQYHFAVRKIGLYPIETVPPLIDFFTPERSV